MQDVKTRWDSTFLMLRRAKRLQQTFNDFYRVCIQSDLQLSKEEWRQVDYLLSITQPFWTFTNEGSKSRMLLSIQSLVSITPSLPIWRSQRDSWCERRFHGRLSCLRHWSMQWRSFRNTIVQLMRLETISMQLQLSWRRGISLNSSRSQSGSQHGPLATISLEKYFVPYDFWFKAFIVHLGGANFAKPVKPAMIS